MSDTLDGLTIFSIIESPVFQDRCRLRFINAAISVTTEVLSGSVAGSAGAGAVNVNLTSISGVTAGMSISNSSAPSTIPAGIVIRSVQGTQVTLSSPLSGSVSAGDVLNIGPVSHAQRLAFAGALFAGNVDIRMLVMAILANAAIRATCLASAGAGQPTNIGGTTLDSDMDFQVASVLTGIATSRSW